MNNFKGEPKSKLKTNKETKFANFSNGNGKHTNTSTNNNGYVDIAERAMWPMKCPPLISRSLRAPPSDHSRPVSKVVVSIDNDDSPPRLASFFSFSLFLLIIIFNIKKCACYVMRNQWTLQRFKPSGWKKK